MCARQLGVCVCECVCVCVCICMCVVNDNQCLRVLLLRLSVSCRSLASVAEEDEDEADITVTVSEPDLGDWPSIWSAEKPVTEDVVEPCSSQDGLLERSSESADDLSHVSSFDDSASSVWYSEPEFRSWKCIWSAEEPVTEDVVEPCSIHDRPQERSSESDDDLSNVSSFDDSASSVWYSEPEFRSWKSIWSLEKSVTEDMVEPCSSQDGLLARSSASDDDLSRVSSFDDSASSVWYSKPEFRSWKSIWSAEESVTEDVVEPCSSLNGLLERSSESADDLSHVSSFDDSASSVWYSEPEFRSWKSIWNAEESVTEDVVEPCNIYNRPLERSSESDDDLSHVSSFDNSASSVWYSELEFRSWKSIWSAEEPVTEDVVEPCSSQDGLLARSSESHEDLFYVMMRSPVFGMLMMMLMMMMMMMMMMIC